MNTVIRVSTFEGLPSIVDPAGAILSIQKKSWADDFATEEWSR